ncbi:hypothetical protein ACOI1H_23190 [Loktanella sp. DJP18]|uniref:hypothetical protein n=1 Tax=Loktanella sp. DJP18 TaxID=3409788 RepID=UPI003BB57FE9
MTHRPENQGADLPPGGIIPTALLPFFWRPRFPGTSPVITCVPLLFWLPQALEARRVAVLGVGDGVAHFALCQALEKDGLTGLSCDGIGFWRGAAEDAPAVPPALREHSENVYDGLSRLHSVASPGAACTILHGADLDLLFIDLDSVPSEDLPWDDIPSMVGASGLVVVHGSADLPADGPAATFLAGHAALRHDGWTRLALCPMGNVPPALSVLLDAAQTSDGKAGLALVLRRLGQGLVAIEETRTLRRQTEDQALVLTDYENTLAKVQRQEAQLQKGYDLRGGKLAELQVRHFTTEGTVAGLHAQAKHQAQLLAQERRLRFDETAALTRMLEHERQAGGKTLAALKAENASLSIRITKLLGSTSWKITAPVRRIRRMVKRR